MFFATNFKKNIECITAIKESIESEIIEIVSVIDLIFKWVAYKLLENNPEIVKGIIELVDHIVNNLISIKY